VARILVIEDEPGIARAVSEHLTAEGYAVTVAGDGRTGLAEAKANEPDLILLDLMLPELSGLDVLRELRRDSTVPVIILTARAEETDRIVGLELGADDYLAKPFSLRELSARIRAVLRRTATSGGPALSVAGPITLDAGRHEVWVNGTPVELTPTEFRLLNCLIDSPGRVFTRLQLLAAAFGDVYAGYERSIDTHVRNLRRKLERAGAPPQQIETVFGIGYRLHSDGPEGGQRP
jgi:two-component system OmpR family response regulator